MLVDRAGGDEGSVIRFELRGPTFRQLKDEELAAKKMREKRLFGLGQLTANNE
jgi:hypothetical protein